MSIARRLRAMRMQYGYTQEEVARAAGMSLNGYTQIERGARQDPHVSTMYKLADALQCRVADLLHDPRDNDFYIGR